MKFGIVAVATAIALAVGTVWVNQAWAQETSEPAEAVGVREEVHQAGLAAAAEVLGMTPDELSDQLWGGKTLAGLAEEANVELGDVRAAVEEATRAIRQERIEAFVAQQVENGRMSQEQADWIMQGIENGWFGLRRFMDRFDGFGEDGFGPGFGRGMGRMRLHERFAEPSE
jgi:hypothetical protein